MDKSFLLLFQRKTPSFLREKHMDFDEGERSRTKVVPNLARKHGITESEAVVRHAEAYALRRITLDADVANACLFLASPVSRQITGVDLPVDGGWGSL